MKEITGNLWDHYSDDPKCIIVITTNGYVKKSGECVMGRGCAKEAKEFFPGIAKDLGTLIKQHGNHVHYLEQGIISFPVKHNWWEDADITLIEQSAQEFVVLVNDAEWTSIVVPRPGCGCGGLAWDIVKPVLEKYLDDRFSIITFR